MKVIIFITLLSFLTTNSQELEYQLYLIDSCNQSIEKAEFYFLKKEGKEYKIMNFGTKIKVPAEGEYFLVSNETEESLIIKISKNHKNDTLVLPLFSKRVKIPGSFTTQMTKSDYKKMILEQRSVWEKCGKPLNGLKKDYFSNGSIRTEGTFNDGYPMGILKNYYQNGNLESLFIYDKEGILIRKKFFDKSGKETTEGYESEN